MKNVSAADVRTSPAAVRRAKAINAVRRMQETSVSLGNDKMTLGKINAIVAGARKNREK